jgi:hypothetical protein
LHIAEQTAGASGAQVKEVAILVLQKAIVAGRVDETGAAMPNIEDGDAALEQMKIKKKAKLGF